MRAKKKERLGVFGRLLNQSVHLNACLLFFPPLSGPIFRILNFFFALSFKETNILHPGCGEAHGCSNGWGKKARIKIYGVLEIRK